MSHEKLEENLDRPPRPGRRNRPGFAARGLIATLAMLVLFALPLAAQSSKKNGLTGWDYFREKRYADALELLKQDHRMWPKIHEIIDGIGWCHYFLGDYDTAEEWFKKALAINADYRYSQMGLDYVKTARLGPIVGAESLLAQGRHADALAAFTDIVNSKTASDEVKTRALRGKGLSHYALGQYQQAMKDLTTVLRTWKDDATTLAGIGYVQFKRNNWNEAEPTLEQAMKLEPKNLEAQLTWAWCAFKRGDAKKADERFRRALEINPQSFGAEIGLGWCADKAKQDDAALDHFKKAVRLSSAAGTDDVLAWARGSAKRLTLFVEYGWALLEAGSYAQAKTVFTSLPSEVDPEAAILGQALATLDQSDNLGALRLARSLLDRSKDPERAIRVAAADAQKKDDGKIGVSASTIAGWALLRTGDVTEAVKSFTTAADRLQAKADAFTGLGYSMVAWGKYPEAEKYFAQAIQACPSYTAATSGWNDCRTWRYADYKRAWNRLEAGDVEDAERAFNAIKADTSGRFPTDRGDLLDYSLGVVARRLAKPKEAAVLFTAAITKNPALSEADVGLGWALLADKRYVEALAALDRAMKARPADPDPFVLAAKTLLAADRKDEAMERLAVWTKTFPASADLAESYGRLLYDAKRWVEARIAFQAVIAADANRLAPSEVDKWIADHSEFIPLQGALGWGLLGQARYKDALPRFKAAVEKEPGDATHQKGLALTLSALGDDAQARTAADAYLATLDKGTAAAASERRSLTMSLAWNAYTGGNYKAALEHFQKIEKAEPGKEGADVLNALGWTYLGMGKTKNARDYFLRALSVSPRLESATQGLEAVQKAESTP